jgi:hypothetical protein
MQRASDHSGLVFSWHSWRARPLRLIVVSPALCAAFAFLCLGVLSIYRAHLVDIGYGQFAGCPHCLDLSVWANDAFLVAVFTAMLALSRVTSLRLARLALAGVALVGIAAYAMDIAVFQLLSQRLLLVDVMRFAGDVPLMTTVVRPLASQPEGWLAVAGAMAVPVAVAIAVLRGPAIRWQAIGWGAVSLVLLSFATFTPRAQYLHQGAFLNLWQVNQWVDPTRPYSDAFWRQVRFNPQSQRLACEAGADQEVSVIVVVVESLSAYHSKLFSGFNDYTPNLDRLAKRGTYFTRFDANEYSTQGALIALLTGFVPYPPAGSLVSTMAYTDVDGDFHRWLRKEGYQTAFFTSGDLSVGSRDRWLRAIGIEHTEGAGHRFYDRMPRGSFGAAEDAALFDRFLAWHSSERKPGPFMATMLTVATHPPFVSPTTGRMDEGASFREVDKQIARLVATLESRRFFDNGVMLIVGDHRAMTPIPAAEQLRFGVSAAARVPAVVLGKTGLALGESTARAQQTDLIPSLRYLIGEHACRTELQGRFLGAPPKPARYVVHVDPIRRNQVAFIEGESAYRLELDGDDTRWTAPPPLAEDADRLLGAVNRERMARMVELGRTASR